MARTIYGAELYKSPTNEVNYADNILGKNSEVFTQGDPVSISSGVLAVIPNGTFAVVGIVAKTATMTSTNVTVAGVKPLYIPLDQDYVWLMGTNYDLTGGTSEGIYYELTGTTGAVQVDVSTGATTLGSRVVMCVAVDPFNEGGSGSGSGLRQGLFKFVKPANFRSDN